MKAYQITNWNENFENAKSRTYDACSFVCMPNKQHGLGFKRIWSQPDGAALFGCWCALLQTLSRQKKPRAGYLTDTGRAPSGSCAAGEVPGTPLTAEDLAFMWGCDPALVQRMLDLMSSPKIGWVKVLDVDDVPADDGIRAVSVGYPRGLLNERKNEENEGNASSPPFDPAEAPPVDEQPASSPILQRAAMFLVAEARHLDVYHRDPAAKADAVAKVAAMLEAYDDRGGARFVSAALAAACEATKRQVKPYQLADACAAHVERTKPKVTSPDFLPRMTPRKPA